MELSTNIMGFYHRFGVHKTLDIFSEAGFRAVDFNTDQPEYYSLQHDRAFYEDLRAYAADRGIAFTQAHAPFGSSFFDPEKTARRFEEILQSFRHCSWLGTEMVVVHPCNHKKYRDSNCWDEMMAYNLDFYRRLIPHARACNLKIAIENIPGSVTDKPEGLIGLVDELNDPVFTVCFDVGHAHMMGLDAADFIRKLGSRIGCTHIHDNNGSADQHTLPYYGTVDWTAVTQAFADIGYDGNISYEAACFIQKLPDGLCADAAKLMAQTGRHLISCVRTPQQC